MVLLKSLLLVLACSVGTECDNWWPLAPAGWRLSAELLRARFLESCSLTAQLLAGFTGAGRHRPTSELHARRTERHPAPRFIRHALCLSSWVSLCRAGRVALKQADGSWLRRTFPVGRKQAEVVGLLSPGQRPAAPARAGGGLAAGCRMWWEVAERRSACPQLAETGPVLPAALPAPQAEARLSTTSHRVAAAVLGAAPRALPRVLGLCRADALGQRGSARPGVPTFGAVKTGSWPLFVCLCRHKLKGA